MIDDASVDEEILHRCTFFQGITEKSRRALLETASAVTVNQGAMIFSAGEPWAAVYVVLTGSVRISVAGDAGEALVLRVLGRGELLGDELMFGNEGSSTHAYSACGAEDTVLLRLERAALQDIAAQEPSLFRWDPQHRGDVAEKDALARSECYRLLNSLEAVDPQAQVSFAAGDIIFKERDDADAVWLIVEGEVIVYPEATPEAPYARLGPGQCFGEKACLNDAPRSATVRALTALAVTRIARDQFVRLHDVSPALRAIVSGLEFTYQMPKCGIALSYVSEKGGESMIERVYRLDDGRRFLTSWVPAKHAFRLESTDLSADDGRSVETVRWTGSASGEQEWQRTIRFSAEGVICGFASLGDWPEMPQAIEAAINAVVFGREALETFRKTGRLDVTRPAQAEEQACFCVQLSVDKFLTLVSEGYDTFEKLREKNGCGSVCGGCEPQVQAMLGRAAWTSVVGHARAMTSDIRSILLKPSCAAQLEWKTGQHVVLSGRLGVHWINRSYTIVSAPGRDSVLEIAVKKEPKGLLSGWLFEEGLVARELRISAPRGDAVWQPGLRPTVCFAAGIGITPAVAISRARHAAAVSMPLHVDYSGKAAEEMAYLSELEDRAATDDAVSLQCRFTATGVRLSAEDVRETARQFPEADFFVCGPEPYMSLVIGALRQAQVPEDHIFDERFTHAGAPLSAPAPATPASEITWSGPDALFLRAQDAALAAGLALVPEELVKRERHPLDRWDELVARADANTFPEGLNVYLTKFHGLFYTAPAQRAFMCRLRIPNGLLRSWQLRGLANVAAACGGDYVDVTTRANLQIREIPAHQSVQVLLAIRGLGLTAQGAGADNLRNITGSPTAGIDPQELMDTRPLCEALHHYILNHREMYGLPRKFNIAFDGGGRVGVLEDTNDIGFVATNVLAAGDVAPGVYFRLLLGGITGHQDFAFDTGVFALPSECVGLSAAIVRVFIRHGDRSNRTKARLKYVLDNLGREAFLAAVEIEWGSPLRRLPGADLAPRLPIDRQGHVGVHPQKQTGRHYLGVVLPVGRISAEQMRGLADIADRFGSGTVRLTVWQNLLISDISTADLDDSVAAIRAIGLDVEATSLRRGLVACTGSAGCKFGAADTKRHALELVDYLEARFTFDGPLNIHLTGCRNSCAQHYIGDIGLAATKIEVDGGMDEGYHVYLGGGAGAAGTQAIARVYAQSVSVAALFPLVEKLIGAWQGNREGPAESFGAFCQRHDLVQLKALAARVSVSAAAPDA